MKKYHEKEWTFLNMNSPADLYADYKENSVIVKEYDRCRDGHALVSKFYVDGEDIFFQTHIGDMGEGTGIGLYFGDGCFDKYCLVKTDGRKASICVSNGVSNGDTFRMQGTKKYNTVAEELCNFSSPFLFGFRRKNQKMTVYINNEIVLNDIYTPLPFDTDDNKARIIAKALNENGRCSLSATEYLKYRSEGRKVRTKDLTVVCREGGIALKDVFIHLAGDFFQCGKTDQEGKLTISNLPCKEYTLICGAEGREFTSISLKHDGEEKIIDLNFMEKTERENIPQENLHMDGPFIGLNGVWKFDFDRDDAGENEGWYKENNHDFKMCIKVPYSWQSLAAFGEEKYADGYSLHQANSFTCSFKETGETAWYQRSFQVDWDDPNQDTELVFAAVSGISKVWCNGHEIGCIVDSYNKHVFSLGKLTPNKRYVLTVKVRYEHNNDWACSGKQGFWFTDSPGIWQNVWLRQRSNTMISDVLIKTTFCGDGQCKLDIKTIFDQKGKLISSYDHLKDNKIFFNIQKNGFYKLIFYYHTPVENELRLYLDERDLGLNVLFEGVPEENFYDRKEIYLNLAYGSSELALIGESSVRIDKVELFSIDLNFSVSMYLEQNEISVVRPKVSEKDGKLVASFTYMMEHPVLWTQNDPFQYKLTAQLRENNKSVRFYRMLGVRNIGTSGKDIYGGNYITLNESKIYIRGVLDQGYNPWGLYTYKSIQGEAAGSAAFDILAAKECGYNLVRMHIKDNEPDWYRICDEKGMMVWDEIPGNFYGTTQNKKWVSMFKRQLRQMAVKHNYHASIAIVSIFNESWGITGDHEKSPWDDKAGQVLIRDSAVHYKEYKNNVLVIDNSGYGKTSETQIIDFHSYPDGFTDARQFFDRLSKQNKKGSCFNFYNQKNKEQFKDPQVRELLQRNCSQDLGKIHFTGGEYQQDQPVIISEFVHTDKQEELVRIFPQFGGYVRMNIISQENEDTSPFTAERVKRDFGYVDDNFNSISYQMVNDKNLLYLDYPFLTQVTENKMLEIPVYLSLWEDSLREHQKIKVEWFFTGIDYKGQYMKTDIGGEFLSDIRMNTPYLCGNICVQIPENYKGGYLFVKSVIKENQISNNYLQFEILKMESFTDRKQDGLLELEPKHIVEKKEFLYKGDYTEGNRNLTWGFGGGEICYKVPILKTGWKTALIQLELSNCTYIGGTRITDQNMSDSEIELFVQNIPVDTFYIKGQLCDNRGIFSNSSTADHGVVKYSRTGKYGYGYRICAEIPKQVIEKIMQDLYVTVTLKTKEHGITVYGNRMGRYGCNPFIEFSRKEGIEEC